MWKTGNGRLYGRGAAEDSVGRGRWLTDVGEEEEGEKHCVRSSVWFWRTVMISSFLTGKEKEMLERKRWVCFDYIKFGVSVEIIYMGLKYKEGSGLEI